MKRQLGYGGFPTVLLTFSFLLLVLAIGFVVGRVVVARAYLQMAPKFEGRAAPETESVAELPADQSPVSRGVHVPPPAPPEAPPDTEAELQEASAEGGEEPAALTGSEGQRGSPQVIGRAQPERVIESARPAETRAPELGPAPAPRQPEPSAPVPVERPGRDAESGVRYAIQVGVFTGRQGARQLVDELARAGYAASIEVQRDETRALYRVLTGRYQTEYAARKALDQLHKEGFEAFLVTK